MNDGGPAYPTRQIHLGTDQNGAAVFQAERTGMSLRDHFAGLAMQAMVNCYRQGCTSRNDNNDGNDETGVFDQSFVEGRGDVAETARAAYILADAMIAERNRNEPA